MEQLVFKSSKSNLYSGTLRFIFGAAGVLYLVMGLSEIYPGWNLETGPVLNTMLGAFILISAIVNPTFGANIELIINDEFLRTTEDVVLTRTAHWHKINKIVLKQFSIGIYYQSGSAEKFRLPYLNSDEFEDLKQRFIHQSKQHHFKLEEKSWWNVF